MSRLDDAAEVRDSTGCAQCGVAVDPLRAARVRLFGDRFEYFCSSACADAFVPKRDSSPGSDTLGAPAPALDAARRSEAGAAGARSKRTTTTERTARPDEPERNLDDHRRPFPPRDEPSASDHSLSERELTERGGSERPLSEPPTADRASTALAAGAPSERRSHSANRARSQRQTQSSRGAPTHAPHDAAESALADRLLSAAVAAGCMAVGLVLAQQSTLTLAIRAVLLLSGNLCLLVFALRFERQAERRISTLSTSFNCLAFTLAAGAWLSAHPEHDAALTFSATLLATSSITLILVRRAFRPVDERLAAQQRWLTQPASRLHRGALSSVTAAELRPGEELVVHAGETVIADVTIVAGNAEVHPWFGARSIQHVGPEDFVYAGAKLASGQLRATVRWTGLDRHWERLTRDPTRRAETHAPIVQLARRLAYRGAPLLGLAALAAVATTTDSTLHWALVALCSLAVLTSPAIDQLAAARIALSIREALDDGVVFRSAAALDATGRVSTAVFCARGTLLMGEPELSSIEASSLSGDEVLSLAAGAEKSEQHPTAVALARAARARGVLPDAVRSPRHEHGLGVTAIASNGQTLVVGSRALLLRERVSIARAEARITELEAMGRTVLLVALGGHMVGILALQDGLRDGARAAVQHLLDAGIEPVLLSGDARKSCEALGRTIDIDHIRPEVLPADRGREVQRLRSGGAHVAVIGRSPSDEIALSAASVAIALPSAGTQNLDYDVELATNEVQKAALALRLAHQCRKSALQSVMIAFGGGAVAVLGVVAFSAPLAFAPLAALVFTVAAAASLPGQQRWGQRSSRLDPERDHPHTS